MIFRVSYKTLGCNKSKPGDLFNFNFANLSTISCTVISSSCIVICVAASWILDGRGSKSSSFSTVYTDVKNSSNAAAFSVFVSATFSSQTKLTLTVTRTLTDTVTLTSRWEIIYAPILEDYQKFTCIIINTVMGKRIGESIVDSHGWIFAEVFGTHEV